jgi:hypothetical protein
MQEIRPTEESAGYTVVCGVDKKISGVERTRPFRVKWIVYCTYSSESRSHEVIGTTRARI